MEEYQYTQEDTQAHLNGLKDVSDLVYGIINGEYIRGSVLSESLTVVMKRQTDHISLMLGKEHIQNSGADLSYFQNALGDGLAWASANS